MNVGEGEVAVVTCIICMSMEDKRKRIQVQGSITRREVKKGDDDAKGRKGIWSGWDYG